MPQQPKPRSWIQAAKAWILLLDSPKHGDADASAQERASSPSDERSLDRGLLRRRGRTDAADLMHSNNVSAINAQDTLLGYVPGVAQSLSGMYQSGEDALLSWAGGRRCGL